MQIKYPPFLDFNLYKKIMINYGVVKIMSSLMRKNKAIRKSRI
jgi:hypothetical protein